MEQKKIRKNCYIQYFFHGFSPIFQDKNEQYFFNAIDEMVVLTQKSYQVYKAFYNVLPCKFSILYNGIDTSKFCLIDTSEKNVLKEHFGIQEETVFLWCSQNRPKKGLKIILEAWRKIVNDYSNIRLIVVGTNGETSQKQVTYIGKVPNDELPKYYQISDVYLFPTLCHEGFGMSLVEALNSGCYCIASNNGGVSEVLQNGALGKLIENPNFVKEWVKAIKDYLDKNELPIVIKEPVYTFEEWQRNMNLIISDAKQSFL